MWELISIVSHTIAHIQVEPYIPTLKSTTNQLLVGWEAQG
jgi:hypothetical protein